MPNKFRWFVESFFNSNFQSKTENSQSPNRSVLRNASSNEEIFKGFIENLPVMFYAAEPTPPYSPIYLSPAFEFLGFTKEDWERNPDLWLQSIHQDDRETVLEQTEQCLSSGEPNDYVYRIKNKNGEYQWVRDRGSLIDHHGKSLWQGVIIDINEQKVAQEELNKRQGFYRAIAKCLPLTGIIIFDHDLRINLADGELLEKLGLTPKMIEGKTVFECFPPKIANALAKYYRVPLAGGFVSVEKDIPEFDVVVHNYFIPLRNENKEIYGGISIWQDITENKRKTEKLRESEERYQQLVEEANDLVYSHDLNGNFISINRAAEKVFGYTLEEITTLNMKQVVAPEFLHLAKEMLEQKLKNKAAQTTYELDCITKDKRRVTLEVNSSVIYKDNKPVSVQGIARDMTDRKHTQEALIQSEERLRNLFENANDLVYLLDVKGNFISGNKAIETLFGYSPEELKEMHFSKVLSPEYLELGKQLLKEKLDGKSRTVYEIVCLTKDGRRVTVEVNSSPMLKDGKVVAIQGIARDITERKITERKIKESEAEFRALFAAMSDVIFVFDRNGRYLKIPPTNPSLLVKPASELIGKTLHDIFAQDKADFFLAKINDALDKNVPTALDYSLEVNGEKIWFSSILSPMPDDTVLMVARDSSKRKNSEKALKESEARYRFLSEGIMHQVWTAEPNGRLDYVNGRTLEYFNKPLSDLLDRKVARRLIHPNDLPDMLERWHKSLKTGELYEMELRFLRHDGSYRWHRSIATPSLDTDRKILKWYGTNTDIHDQKIAEEKLNYFAKHDSLTNLPNRVKFMGHLERVIKRVKFMPHKRFAVLFLDIDRFKLINDSLGHLIGDKLLISFAERLEECIRPGDIVARLGGDEFTILLNNLVEDDDAIRVTNRLIQKLNEPFYLDEYEVFTSASIGIVVSDGIARTPEDFLRDADTAMYRAKEAGKARYEIFNDEMHVRNKTLLRIENDLRRAIERNEFRVLYQPIICLETGEICEFEALIRWHHPEHGLVAPSEFIKVAEETGLIVQIGNWIIKEATRQTAEWQRNFPQINPFMISINLSAKQLMHPPLIEQIKEVLAENRLDPRTLRLEVTESVVMENSDFALNVLNELKQIGVSLSTDDFGTGFSSLSYLHRFPFDSLKIDRSFIGQIDTDKKSSEIVRTILMLAQNLNLEVIAEGIETEEQLRQLQILGCRFGQGYLFSKPVNASEIEQLLVEKSNGFRFDVPPDFIHHIPQSNEIH